MQKLLISLGVLAFSAAVGAQDIGLKMAPSLKQPPAHKSKSKSKSQAALLPLSVDSMPRHAARDALTPGGQLAGAGSTPSETRWVVLPWVVRTSDSQRDIPRSPSELSKSIRILGSFQVDVL